MTKRKICMQNLKKLFKINSLVDFSRSIFACLAKWLCHLARLVYHTLKGTSTPLKP